jgi:hypothetical protein
VQLRNVGSSQINDALGAERRNDVRAQDAGVFVGSPAFRFGLT